MKFTRAVIQQLYRCLFCERAAGNWCFHGLCSCHCRLQYATCDHDGLLEGSVSYGLPSGDEAPWSRLRNPWIRTYKWISREAVAEWEKGPMADGYCVKVRATPPWSNEGSLLSLVDLHIFDFLQGKTRMHILIVSGWRDKQTGCEFNTKACTKEWRDGGHTKTYRLISWTHL